MKSHFTCGKSNFHGNTESFQNIARVTGSKQTERFIFKSSFIYNDWVGNILNVNTLKMAVMT